MNYPFYESIYNSTYNYDKWNYGHLFYNNPIKDDENTITSFDSLVPDCEGKIKFAIYPSDIGYISAIVGVNSFFDNNFGDLGGAPQFPIPDTTTPPYDYPASFRPFDPSSQIYSKFWGDETFYLDWDAHTDSKIAIDIPKAKVFNATIGEELPKSIYNKDYYDLTYGIENWLKVEMTPADSRDLPIKFGQVQIVGMMEYGSMEHIVMIE